MRRRSSVGHRRRVEAPLSRASLRRCSSRGVRVLLARDVERQHPPRSSRRTAARKSAGERVFIIPMISTSGAGRAACISASARASAAAPWALWPPSSQSSWPAGSMSRSLPLSGASRAGHSTVRSPSAMLGLAHRQPEVPRRGDRQRGILELVEARERRRRQVEQAVLVLVDQPARLRGSRRSRGPATNGVTPQLRRARFEHREPLVALAAEHRRAAALQDAGLVDRDLGDGLAEIVLVVDVDRRDDDAERMVDDVGRVERAAHARLRAADSRPASRRRASAPPRS